MSKYDTSTRERFWSKVNIKSPEECWEWQGSRRGKGYGAFKSVSYKTVNAHRYAYEAEIGDIPEGMFILHKCDNRLCVNPNHLFLGTHQDNMDDMWAKGRGKSGQSDQRGEKNGNRRLSEIQVRYIKALISMGWDNKQIAKHYGVTHSMISCIRLRKNWADTDELAIM